MLEKVDKMKYYTVVFNLVGGFDFAVSIYASSRSDAIKRARRERMSNTQYARYPCHSITTRAQ